jgi:hypothetical protein
MVDAKASKAFVQLNMRVQVSLLVIWQYISKRFSLTPPSSSGQYASVAEW